MSEECSVSVLCSRQRLARLRVAEAHVRAQKLPWALPVQRNILSAAYGYGTSGGHSLRRNTASRKFRWLNQGTVPDHSRFVLDFRLIIQSRDCDESLTETRPLSVVPTHDLGNRRYHQAVTDRIFETRVSAVDALVLERVSRTLNRSICHLRRMLWKYFS